MAKWNRQTLGNGSEPAEVPLKEALSSGFNITRSVTPVARKVEGVWTAGDIIRVRLEVESQSDMTWIVVNDPVPSGSSILCTMILNRTVPVKNT